MKTLLKTSLVLGALFLTAIGTTTAQDINPTPFFTSFADTLIGTTQNGEQVPVGSIIEAYDPDGVLCGRDTVTTAGTFGFFPVYGDDPNTAGVDEGAEAGQTITFMINGRSTTVDAGDDTWTDQTVKSVTLSSTATVALTAINLPNSRPAAPGDTIRFQVDVRNDGDGLDFYGVNLSMTEPNGTGSFDWEALEPDSFVYAESGETVSLFFDIRVPLFVSDPFDTVNTVTYTVFSNIDTTVTVVGNVDVFLTITDVDDNGNPILPSGFVLEQNYPNPFNPTTTIAFSLPSRSQVRLDVYDALGRTVDSRDLGSLPSGSHEVHFDAGELASGMYFYRLTTDFGSEARKMVLLK